MARAVSHGATNEICRELSAFTSCDVADALIQLGVPGGGLLPDITAWSPQRDHDQKTVVGPAYTVKYEYIDPINGPVNNQTGHYVDGAPAGSVIFISCPRGMIHACWGGLTTRRAKMNGVVGTIVDGRVRDLGESRELGFPVFARGIAPTPPHGTAQVTMVRRPSDQPVINEAVTCQQGEDEFTIRGGDVLVGDVDGVVCVPQELVGRTLEVVRTIVELEHKKTAAIDQGMSMTEASKIRLGTIDEDVLRQP